MELPDGQEIIVDRFVYNLFGMKFYVHYGAGRKKSDYCIPFTLQSREYKGRTSWFVEEFVSDTQSVFEGTDNTMYEVIPTLDEWQFDLRLRFYKGEDVYDRVIEKVFNVPMR